MTEPRLIPVFVPDLIWLLQHSEANAGRPLTEQEVLDVRDKGVIVVLSVEDAIALNERRGYSDIEPERAWEQWQDARRRLQARAT